ncbi:MAG: rod shape-determining protein MreD [Firmicutes bacterium HGW-Firmicutes-1]|jgi:rod shape-determining protein MreD|nr:MAG: rod shape-determining protein MreD [Firmicutes bacterium HGW-Firmicutes-1]
MVRVIAVIAIIIFNIVFQSTIVQNFAIGGITINLLIMTVVSFSLMRGKLEGAIIGFFIGLMQDVFFGSVIGFYALLYMYFGFFSGYLNKALYRDNLLIPILAISVSDLILNLFIYIMTYLFRGRTDFPYYFTNIILPELVYTTLVAVFVYKFYMFVNEKLDSVEKRRENKDKV